MSTVVLTVSQYSRRVVSFLSSGLIAGAEARKGEKRARRARYHRDYGHRAKGDRTMGKKGGRRKLGRCCGRRREEVGSWWWKWRAQEGVGLNASLPDRPPAYQPCLLQDASQYSSDRQNSRTQLLSAGDVRRSRHRYDTHRTTELRAIQRSGNVLEVTCRVVSLCDTVFRVPCPFPALVFDTRRPRKFATQPRCTTTAGNHSRRRTPPVRNATARLSYGSAGNQRAAVPRVPVKDATLHRVIGDAADFGPPRRRSPPKPSSFDLGSRDRLRFLFSHVAARYRKGVRVTRERGLKIEKITRYYLYRRLRITRPRRNALDISRMINDPERWQAHSI